VAVFITLLILVNVLFAIRSIDIAVRGTPRIDPHRRRDDLPALSIIVPARNEEYQIERCVSSLLAQDYPDFEVIVVDDHSTDNTAKIVERLAATDPRLTLVRGGELPRGWVGKPWAISQGLAHARGSWLLFTDADTFHEPNAASAAVGCALDRDVNVLSLLTDQEMVSVAERVFLPSILWTIAFGTGPLADVNNPARENAIFNGQYLLFERHAYESLGGHEAVRGEIAEDLELARLVKTDGRFRSALVTCGSLVRTRMYRNFGELWNGFVKNFALGTRGQPIMTAAAITFFALVAPITPLAALTFAIMGSWNAAGATFAAMLLAMVTAEIGLRRVVTLRWSALGLPLGITLMVAIFVASVVSHRFGTVAWRGRSYSSE
jgi:chlorobactene glucosyltransferase